MIAHARAWPPMLVLVGGVALLGAVGQQHRPSLRAPLHSALPHTIREMSGSDVTISEGEASVAGFTDYALRVYEGESQVLSPGVESPAWASVYLGYYDTQTRGRTIHSPRNCLPGAGWEVLTSRADSISTGDGAVTVNRYVLQNGDEQALVLYWYQGRGRVAHNEYLVKWDLLRDAALKKRTDEALVRIVVPILTSEDAAFDLAEEVALKLQPAVEAVLPAAP